MCVDVKERQREWKRERVWKGEDRGRKGGIPEILHKRIYDVKLLDKIMTQKKDTKLWPSISL